MFMKKLILLKLFVVITGLCFISCDSDTSSNNPNPNSNVITSFSGTVNSLPANSRIIKAVMAKDSLKFTAGSDTASSNNTFSISLSTPPDNMLSNITDLFSFIPFESNGSSVARGNFIVNQTFENEMSNFNGTIIKSNRIFTPGNIEVGDFSISYLYCNMNETFSGSYLSVINSDSIKYNVTLNLETGYIPVTYKLKAKRTFYSEIDITSGEASGGNWYYQGLFDNAEHMLKHD